MKTKRENRCMPELLSILESIKLEDVQVVTKERIRGKEFCKELQKLCSKLKIRKYLSISKRQGTNTVYVVFPCMYIGLIDWKYENDKDIGRCMNLFDKILLTAFPNCGDKSDLSTDHFDFIYILRS